MSPKSGSQLRHIDPAAFAPGLESQLGQLNAPGAFEKIVREGNTLRNVAKKKLPLNLESVVEDLIVRHIRPMLAKLEWIGDVWVPNWARRIDPMLRSAFTQAGNCAAQGAIH